MKTSIFISLLSLCLFSLSTAAPPVPFSGKLAVDGKNFHGNARFSFSIVDGQGDEHWRHSQEQGSMIDNVVLNGRYLVLLGGQGMKALPPRLFLDYDQLFLRVQVDLQDGQGIRLLEPDQRITSSPYALTAELARLAEKASVADAVSPGSITQDMLADGVFADLNRTIELSDLPAEVLQGLSRTITLNDLGLDVVAELNSTIDHSRLSVEVREDLNRTTVITREMLPQNVRDDLNRTIGVAQLSAEVNEKLNRDFTIQPGSISKSLLGQDVLSDLNRTVQRHHLSEDLRAELNRTIRLRDLAPEVISDLNDSIQYGSITLDLLSSQVRNDLNRTITKSMLAEDIKNDLNRTITLAMLPQEVRDDLNRTTGVAQLSSEVAGALKPVISGSPVSIHAHAGEGATLHVQANGGNLSYQWKKEGVSLAGATSRVLTISDLNASQHEGNYTVVVSNTFGSTTSSVAQIDVNGSLTEGLAAWWKFDETAGDVAYDSSGNGNDGNLTNGPTWSEGKIGGALSFDGTNDMVRTNLSGSYNEDFTWSAWIKTTDTQGGVLGLSGDTWEVGGASFYLYQGNPKVDVHSVGAKLGNFNLSSNTWTHYLLTVKDSGGTVDPVRIFVNGLIEIDSTLNWFTYNGQNFNLRIAHVPTHGEYYEGLIDDVRIYDRVLSTVEVKALYELGEQPVQEGGSGSTTVVNGTVADGSITTNQLSEQILKYLKPEITQQPTASTIFADTNASLSVSAEGKYLTYQWKKNGTALAGETNATLSITDANATQHDGNYSVVVSNDFGSVESGEMEINVVTEVLDGLVGWWPLDWNTSDLSGLGNHGIISGSPSWVSGKIGGAFSFNGSETISSNANYGTQNTISVWCNFSSTATAQYQMVWSFSNPNLSFTASNVSLNSFDGSGNKFADFNTLEYAGQWLHFVTINTTGQTELFLNAQSLGTANYVSPEENIFVIGRSGYSLKGMVDEVRIYDRALSNAEVQALYNLGQ